MSRPFHLRINGGPEQTITVESGIYMHAAMASLAILGIQPPVEIEIWSPDLIPEYGPYVYLIDEDEFGRLIVSHAVRIEPKPQP